MSSSGTQSGNQQQLNSVSVSEAAALAGNGDGAQNTIAQFPTPDELKIDPVTALQDTIDSLSLSLFESLRGLRDAVAPQVAFDPNSANASAGIAIQQNGENNTRVELGKKSDPLSFSDYGEYLATTIKNLQPAGSNLAGRRNPLEGEENDDKILAAPLRRDEYNKLVANAERDEDTDLVKRLASTVLEKSQAVDESVSNLPGMGRTKCEQMTLIGRLLEENRKTECELAKALAEAANLKNEVRSLLRETTSKALGIEEEL